MHEDRTDSTSEVLGNGDQPFTGLVLRRSPIGHARRGGVEKGIYYRARGSQQGHGLTAANRKGLKLSNELLEARIVFLAVACQLHHHPRIVSQPLELILFCLAEGGGSCIRH